MMPLPPPVLTKLPILILHPHSRCNCRCLMCDIWKITDAQEITAEDLERHIAGIQELGVEWVVFSGGEPLMHSDLFRLSAVLRRRGIKVTILSTGLLLARNAQAIAENTDDLIVSLDGPAEIHDAIRRIPSAFQMLKAGVKAVKAISPDFPVHARCTIQRSNCRHLRATVATAREIGLDGISFLAADLTSTAFNRPEGWTLERTGEVALNASDISALEAGIDAMIRAGESGGFVAETPAKLRRIAAHFHAHLKGSDSVAPVCNAPWVSVVVETDGTVRPCFFHRAIGRLDATTSLIDVINGPAAAEFRASLDVASHPICKRCVCSLNWQP